MVQALARGVLIWVNLPVTAQRIRSSYAGLTRLSIIFTKMDCRVISREDARSLSSGRALRGPVGAFPRQ
jgi:hypothetical protein